MVGFAAFSVIAFAGMIVILSIGLPDVGKLENLLAAQSTEIFDRNGELLYTIHGEENREHVDIENISKYIVDATVAIEDSGFWDHRGFDVFAVGRGVLYELFGIGTPRGGSTITQQYIKNAFLSPERSYIRKARELILAIRLERALEKEEILELYLNRIPYGNNAYGVEKAAEVYFGKNADELTLAQAAILASLPQAPSRYNPYGNNKYSHLLKEFTADELHFRKIEDESDLEIEEYARGLIGKRVDLGNGQEIYIQGRTDLVLKQMQKFGEITIDERQEALNELQAMEFNEYRESITSPHFVLYVKQILEDKYGKDVVENGGLKVYTTLDAELQKYAEEVVAERGEANLTNFGADNMALMTVDVQTGQILAMVGSRDYFDEEIDGNVNVILRPRQPGSSFKPIVYAQAFYNGYGPGSVVFDVPTKVGNDRPQNFDGQWKGQITVREALGQSRNIPAIKTYFVAGQQDPIIDLATKLGITTLTKAHSYGYPLALGAGEIPPIEMLTAFSTFATGGKRPEFSPILKVENANGDVLEEWKEKEFEEVLDPQVAYLINSILSDQSVAIGPNLSVSGHTVAAKTGTSTKQNKKEAGGAVLPSDGWTIGYSPQVATVVWAGNTDGAGMKLNANGYDMVSRVFNSVMSKALQNYPSQSFVEPEGIKHVQISKATGKLPGPDTPESMVKTEIFASFAVPTEVETNFYRVKIDRVSGLLATEYTPPDAVEEVVFQNYQDIAPMFNWQQEIVDYYADLQAENAQVGEMRVGLPPTEYDTVHTAATAANAPSIVIGNLASGSSLGEGAFEVTVDLEAKNGVDRVEFYIDEDLKYFTSTPPYSGQLNISRFMQLGSRHLIVAKVVDSLGYSAQSAVEIKVSN